MFKKIFRETILHITHDLKLIRLSFIVTFCHSLSIIVLFAWNINNLLIYRFDKGYELSTVFKYILDGITQNHIIILLIVLAIFFAIGYSILYPIGEAALIHFLHDKKNSISKALGKGAHNFFSMFEFSALTFSFGASTFFFTGIRLFVLDIMSNAFIIALAAIWLLSVLATTILRPYTKFAITLERKGLYDAIKRSVSLSFSHIGITMKFAFFEMLLMARFLLNGVIVIGVPILLTYIAVIFDILDNAVVNRVLWLVTILLVIFTSYINAIISAFFAAYRYKIYSHIIHEEKDS